MEIASLRTEVARDLTARYGKGHWSSTGSERGVLLYDAEAGAAGFCRKCGFREVGRAAYRKVPLVYLEMLL